MGQRHSHFECQQCGYQTPRWLGRCPDCGTWGRLTEFVEAPPGASERAQSAAPPTGPPPVPLTEVPGIAHRIAPTGIGELDRVLGGGLVPGGVILIGGDPGIGKSTLVLQAAGALALRRLKVLYVSGEESLAQIGERGRRLGVNAADLYLAAETSLEAVVEQIGSLKPAAVIVDSIQTVWSRSLESAAGSLSQVREVAGRLTEIAKRDEVGVWLIGHVTKEGNLAGPRALEHLVDTVVYFEGDRQHSHRILRATKNRFGPTDEIGVFEMRASGLTEVADPSGMFLSGRSGDTSGTVVFPAVEGTRPLLVEVQALASQSYLAIPRRTTLGADANRVIILSSDSTLDSSSVANSAGESVINNMRTRVDALESRLQALGLLRPGPGELAASDNQVFLADGTPLEPAFQNLAHAGCITRLG